ncbi:MAG: GNAT family N-acetyltransferase [Candidatus Obscuribacterales bacterium]|nr:GNAT family N-acetyltransferase [Steroidobacteraceae bacterium]
MQTAFTVRDANWRDDQHALQQVRQPVFVVEQHVDAREEFDDVDLVCQHVLAADANNIPIGTGRIDAQGKIGRMAVLAPWRNHGVGVAILQRLIAIARARGDSRVYLHSQVSALGFYQRAHFVPYGERFYEAGIEHQAMTLNLSA